MLLYFQFWYSQHWLTLIRTTIMHFYDSLMLFLQHSLAVTCATRCRDFFFAHFFLNLYKKKGVFSDNLVHECNVSFL